MNKKYHYVYKTTVDHEKYEGFYYYGKHSTANIDDNYVGSGIKISNLSKKGYTLNREILCFFDSSEEALEFEELLVDEDMLKDPYCMNLKTGGGWGYEYSEKSKAKMSKSAIRRGVSHLQNTEVREKAKKAQSETRKKLWEDPSYRERVLKRGHYSRSCITPMGKFNTVKEASEATGMSIRTLGRRLADPSYPTFYYGDQS